MMTAKKTYAVIRAVYDNNQAAQNFERELDFLLTRKVGVVIIEPETLGELTWRWIRTGNWLHKTAVICGFSALTSAGIGLMWNSYQSLGLISFPDTRLFSIDHPTELLLLSLTPRVLRFTTTLCSALSATSAAFYALFWQWDPCCKYQVVSSLSSLPRGLVSIQSPTNGHHQGSLSPGCGALDAGPISPGNDISPNGSSSHHSDSRSGASSRGRRIICENRHQHNSPPLRPVVLVHRDDGRRKLLHNSLAFTSAFVAGYILYQWSQPADLLH